MNIIKNIFIFRGRLTRLSFFISLIIFYIGGSFINASRGGLEISGTNKGTSLIIENIILLFISLILIWFIWAQGSKRCHDIGNSGWFQFIPFYVFVMLFQDGDEGSNKYGKDPKYRK